MILTKTPRYTPLAITLHWLLAILITGMMALGWYMLSIEHSPGSGWYFMLHQSIGLIIIILVIMRLVWRLLKTAPSLPTTIPKWQITASKLSHWLLYALMIGMPFVGLTGSFFSKDNVSFFGVALPRITSPNHDLSEIYFSMHSAIAWFIVVLVAVHVLAALKHLMNKDGIFQRMWFSKK